MDRKTFIRKTTAGLILGIPAITLLGCSGSDDSGPNNPNPNPPVAKDCIENGTLSTVATSDGHTHSLTVSKEDVQAGVEKTYDLSLVDGHIHQVTISAAQFQTLQANNSVSATTTSNDGHSHGVSVTCA